MLDLKATQNSKVRASVWLKLTKKTRGNEEKKKGTKTSRVLTFIYLPWCWCWRLLHPPFCPSCSSFFSYQTLHSGPFLPFISPTQYFSSTFYPSRPFLPFLFPYLSFIPLPPFVPLPFPFLSSPFAFLCNNWGNYICLSICIYLSVYLSIYLSVCVVPFSQYWILLFAILVGND